MAKSSSGVEGAQEAASSFRHLAAHLDGLDRAMAAVATDRAKSLAPTLAQLTPPTVRHGGTTLNYSGVINTDAFGTALAADLEPRAATAADAEVDAATQRAGLT